MASQLTLGRPYARAVFQWAQAQGNRLAWQQFLECAAQLMQQPILRHLLANPNWTTARWVSFILDCVQALGFSWEQHAGFKPLAENLLRLLAVERRLYLLPAIAHWFQHQVILADEVVKVATTSAVALSDAQKEQLVKRLEQRLKAKIKIEYGLDPSLLGGLVIRTDEWVIDASVKGRLNQLTEQLAQAI